MKKLKLANNIFKDTQFSTKVYLTFSSKIAGDAFDPYEKNYTKVNLNPTVIRAYVREINPEALVWKQYGLQNIGAMEILTEAKYEPYFEKCSKITIDGHNYEVFKEGTGGRSIMSKRPFQTLRVVVTRKD